MARGHTQDPVPIDRDQTLARHHPQAELEPLRVPFGAGGAALGLSLLPQSAAAAPHAGPLLPPGATSPQLLGSWDVENWDAMGVEDGDPLGTCEVPIFNIHGPKQPHVLQPSPGSANKPVTAPAYRVKGRTPNISQPHGHHQGLFTLRQICSRHWSWSPLHP